jgi:hypothetical protein
MKNISTGFGLALLAGAIVTHTLVTNLASTANASAVTSAASAVSTAVAGQTGPTIVWYGAAAGANVGATGTVNIVRAWSNGRVEMINRGLAYVDGQCFPTTQGCPLGEGWTVVSDPAQGLTFRSDINFDAKVDGADLGQLLADWGDAPRQDIPPSDCPLNLVNP